MKLEAHCETSRIKTVFSVALRELFVLGNVSQSDAGTVNGKLTAKISGGRDICYSICNYSQSYFYLSHLSYYTLVFGVDQLIHLLILINCV